jgi:predicted metal-dependent phosphoesterase TrpH
LAVDLHTHTTYSDGTCSPSDLLDLAIGKNLKAIAITDHDITSANSEALLIGKKSGIEVIPGVELSVDYPNPYHGHLHLVGLFIDPDNETLNKSLQIVRQARDKRNHKIVARLNELNMDISYIDLVTLAGQGAVGRPHIARMMVDKGYVSSVTEAFQRFLKNGAPAYFDRMRLAVDQAIGLIHQAGGIAIIAHPTTLGFPTFDELSESILQLKDRGLDGFEVFCADHTAKSISQMLEFAGEHQLVVSGGSDFHGDVKPEQDLGSVEVPDWVYRDLVAYWKIKGKPGS